MLGFKRVAVAVCALALALCVAPLAGCGGGGSASGDAKGGSDTAQSASATDASSDSATGGSAAGSGASAAEAEAPAGQYASGIHHAVLNVAGYEPIEITLDADAAPITVANFADLVNSGYYNGKTFYRFQDGFCMQGGTLGNSASGVDPSVQAIAGEFSGNGYENALADNFERGTIAMARTSDPDSASTTFFVTLDSDPSVAAALNGQYAAFGTIDGSGMQVVDQIVADHAGYASDSMGMVDDEANQAVIESIEMVD